MFVLGIVSSSLGRLYFVLHYFGYSSLKNKVTWQVTSFSRYVFVELAELSDMIRYKL